MKARRRWLLAAAIVLLSGAMTLAIACSSNNDNDGGGKATATEAIGGTPTEAGQTPSETMAEMPADTVHIEMLEFTITGLDGGEITGLTAGTVVFEVHNDGTVPHSFIIIKTDTDAGSLPVSGNAVDVSAAGDKIGDSGEFPSGEIKTLSADLEPGKYALICNIVGHYQQGMYATLDVM